MALQYAVTIYWSDEDEGYIAVVPDLSGCSAFGETPEIALREIMLAMELWLSTAKELGRRIPPVRKTTRKTASKHVPARPKTPVIP